MSKKNLIAGQSGGPTAAINSSLYGVVSEALKHTEEIDHVYGMVNGIEQSLIFRKHFRANSFALLPGHLAPILAPAVTNFLNLWKIRFIRSCSGNSRR